MTILAIMLIWTGVSFIVAPFAGRFLKRVSEEQSYPLPSGSILDRTD